MVVPVPVVLHKEDVKTLSPDVFKHVDQLTAPRLVEYWEQDPCNPDTGVEYKRKSGGIGGMSNKKGKKEDSDKDLGVKIEAQFEVGEYQILVLSAKESTGLETWLNRNKYKIPQGAAAALAPYVRDQMKFFVAKVDIKKVHKDEQGTVVLSPLRFGYESAELRLPVRLGLLNADGKQDLIVYVLHPEKRFELANYPNVFIPTNIEVSDSIRTQFPAFYAELFDETLRRNNNKAVITEYSWSSSGCDPCPSPPLSASDLYTLGDESFAGQRDTVPSSPLAPAGKRMPRGGFFGSGPSYVVTRLHTRYSKDTLSEDLIFRAAEPVMGGRANWQGGLGDHGAQVQQGGTNNFQGRYIIRHYDRAAGLRRVSARSCGSGMGADGPGRAQLALA